MKIINKLSKNDILRVDIERIIDKISFLVAPEYAISSDFGQKLNEYWVKLKNTQEINGTSNFVKINTFLFISEKQVLKLKCTQSECLRIDKEAKRLILSLLKKSEFARRLNKVSLSNISNTTKRDGLLFEVKSFVDITLNIQNILFSLLKNPSDVITYKFEWLFGKALILDLFNKIVNINSIQEGLILDFADEKHIHFLFDEFARKTPRIPHLKYLFLNTQKIFLTVSNKIVYLFILSYFYYKIFNVKNINNALVQALIKHFKTHYPTFSKLQKYVPSILTQDETCTKSDLTIVLSLKRKILNIINVYAKIFGIEAVSLLESEQIISQKLKNNTYILLLNRGITCYSTEHNLPVSYLSKNTESKTYFRTSINNVICNDDMECEIHDKDVWLKSQGKLCLNLVFVKDFVKNFYYLLQKNENSSVVFNEKQIIFLNQCYNVNFFCLQSKRFKDILSWALNFKNLKKFYIDDREEYFQVKDLLNKVFQKKFVILQILTDLKFLLRLEHFEFEMKFDMRGRAYPVSSVTNYFDPLFKYFTSWWHNSATKYKNLSTEKIKNIEINLLKQCQNIYELSENVYINKLEKKTQFCLMDFCGLSKLGKVFEAVILYNDLLNCKQKQDYIGSYGFAVDARGSGFQILTMLLNSQKMALKAGFFGENYLKNDIYTEFVTFFQNLKDGSKFTQINCLKSLNLEIQTFLEKYLTEIILKGSIIKLFEIQTFCDDFSNLFHKCSWDKELLNSLPLETYIRVKINVVINVLKKKNIYVKNSRNRLLLFLKLILLNLEEILFKNIFRDFIPLVTRKLSKNAIMTFFYGSTIKSRKLKYLEQYIAVREKNNESITQIERQHFFNFCSFLDFKLRSWINTEIPEANIINLTLKKYIKNNLFNLNPIHSAHVTWIHSPYAVTKYSKSIYNKDFKMQKYSDELDVKKLASSFLPNYIQLCDSIICSDIIAQMKLQNIPIKTIHDCFIVPYLYAEELTLAIYNAYSNFFQKDYLFLHFTKYNPVFLGLINQFKIDNNVEPIDVSQLKLDSFAKY